MMLTILLTTMLYLPVASKTITVLIVVLTVKVVIIIILIIMMDTSQVCHIFLFFLHDSMAENQQNASVQNYYTYHYCIQCYSLLCHCVNYAA